MARSPDGAVEPAAGTPDQKTLRRAIAASAIGNMTEWFDYGVYAYTATFIGQAFFPSEDRTASTLGSLLVFAVSFLIRPIGGMVWGPLGDRIGRQRVLATTILLMAGATLCVGVLPGYATLGIAAPILLILLRMIQGFSTGGEYGGAATFMAEYAPDRKRGLFGSFLEFGTLAGFTLGATLALIAEAIVGHDNMVAWGWRLPFLVAAPLGLIGLYLRSKLEDTPVFRECAAEGQIDEKTSTQIRDLLKFWRPLLLLMGLVVTLNIVNYTLLAYMPTYLEGQLGLSSTDSLILIIIGQLAMMVVLPFSGGWSDKVGRKTLWWISIIGLFVMAIPMFQRPGLLRRGGRVRRAGPAVRAAAVDDLRDVPGHVPDPRPVRGLRDRLQPVDLAVRRHGPGDQRGADQVHRRPAVPGVLHDGRLRDRRDRVGLRAGDAGVFDPGTRDPRSGHEATAGAGGGAGPLDRAAPSARRACGRRRFQATLE
jgi:MFS transporter, MHS family, proline/betaine transporter